MSDLVTALIHMTAPFENGWDAVVRRKLDVAPLDEVPGITKVLDALSDTVRRVNIDLSDLDRVTDDGNVRFTIEFESDATNAQAIQKELDKALKARVTEAPVQVQ